MPERKEATTISTAAAVLTIHLQLFAMPDCVTQAPARGRVASAVDLFEAVRGEAMLSIREGMTPREVERVLGRARAIVVFGAGAMVLFYNEYGIRITFSEKGRVIRVDWPGYK